MIERVHVNSIQLQHFFVWFVLYEFSMLSAIVGIQAAM